VYKFESRSKLSRKLDTTIGSYFVLLFYIHVPQSITVFMYLTKHP